jgi:hypothetical protein
MPAFWWPKWAGDPVMSAGFTCTISAYLLTYTKQSLAYGGGGGGAQPDANETIYFILFICKCFNNKGVTVCNWCYNCWNNPTNKVWPSKKGSSQL